MATALDCLGTTQRALALALGLEREGYRLEIRDPDRLVVSPVAGLTGERLAELRAHKPALRNLLRALDEGVMARRDTFRAEHAASGVVGPFIYKPGVPYVKGRCFSCGDQLEAPRFGRCWRCALGWRLALAVPAPKRVAKARDEAKLAG